MLVDPKSPQVVASYLSEPEAMALASHLQALGIPAHVWGAHASIAWPELPRDVQVVVPQADVSRAHEAIQKLRGKFAEDQ